MVGDRDQILGARCVADQHGLLVIAVDDLIDRVDLLIDLISCCHIFAGDQHQLVAASVQDVRHFLRKDLSGDSLSHKAVKGDDALYAVQVLDLCRHPVTGLGVQIRVRKDHQRVVHTEGIFHLLTRYHGRQVLGQRLNDVVVDIIMCIAVDRRDPGQKEHDKDCLVVLLHESRDLLEIRKKGFVPCLLDQLLKSQDHRGQYRYTADDTERDAFHHDKTYVQSEAESHKAQCREACNGSYGRSDYGLESLVDRNCHSLFIILILLLVFLKAVPQKDRIIHCDAQLQDGCQRLCNIRYFTEEIIGTQIVYNRNSDRKEEEYRRKECIHAQRQYDRSQQDSKSHVDGFLCLREILCIGDDRRHTLQIASAVQDLSDFGHSVHSLIG